MKRMYLDMASTTGFVLTDGDQVVEQGNYRMRMGTTERLADAQMRVHKFLSGHRPDMVIYEEPMRHGNSNKALLIAHHLESAVHMWCSWYQRPYVSYMPSKIRKGVLGSGRVDKSVHKDAKQWVMFEMVERGFEPVDDNHADAIMLMLYHQDREGLDLAA